MAFNPDVHIHPVYFDNLDDTIDEKGSMFIALRKTQWVKDGDEPDKEKAKIEIRKFRITAEGEKPDKGVAFLTPEGPGELARTLIHEGFGDTKKILLELKDREDFKDAVTNLYNKEEESADGDFFDMRDALLAEETMEE